MKDILYRLFEHQYLGRDEARTTGTRISSNASRKPANSSTEILRIRYTVIKLAICESLYLPSAIF